MRSLVAIMLFLFAALSMAQEPQLQATKPNEHPTSYWMQKKTEVSQNIFASLATGDFDKLEKLSNELMLLGKVEGFVRSKIPGYASHLQTFQFANQELGRQARNQNIEGAALAFHQMTISCVSCHKLIREQKQ